MPQEFKYFSKIVFPLIVKNPAKFPSSVQPAAVQGKRTRQEGGPHSARRHVPANDTRRRAIFSHKPPKDQHQRAAAADCYMTHVKQEPVWNLSVYISRSRFSAVCGAGEMASEQVSSRLSSKREVAVSLGDGNDCL